MRGLYILKGTASALVPDDGRPVTGIEMHSLTYLGILR
jgi:hypothetical protein